MAISNKQEQDEIVADINMTPLIDVMLVLLIIFMVSSSAALESALNVQLPEANAVSATPETNLVITLTKDGQVAVAGKLVTMATLKEEIKEGLVKLKTSSVVLEGDGESSLTSAIDVMGLAKEAGAKDFSIAAKLKSQ